VNFKILIPARAGSKGLPKKNQLLLEYTLNEIPPQYHKNVIISTDDEQIIKKVSEKYNACQIHLRSKRSARDTASTKECIQEVIDEFSIDGVVVMLYLTYPNRKWSQVIDAINWFRQQGALSLLCREEINTHPYLCLYEKEHNKGKQIVRHDLYRRQDYPSCFKICHMISIFITKEFKNLNKNMYNEETVFYKIPKTLDVDEYSDFKEMER
tara:strand:+ start:10305 stop:10937 length:633 start_codon:yes stop_codon:yes gene_type:complete